MPRSTIAIAVVLALAVARPASAQEKIQLDPFARATLGYAQCKEQPPPLLTPDQARHEAHVRSERGFRCADEGKCEPGGAYKRDPEINERIRALIAGDARYADTSVWVTTSRRWVTLQGCVRTKSQRQTLVKLVGSDRQVERVFDELAVGRR
jgi:hypothetical protein